MRYLNNLISFLYLQTNFLRNVPLLSGMPDQVLTKLGDVLETEQFSAGDYIIREGTVGDTFYIIAEGEVRVTKSVGEEGTEEMIRDLQSGDYFGEQVREYLLYCTVSSSVETNIYFGTNRISNIIRLMKIERIEY